LYETDIDLFQKGAEPWNISYLLSETKISSARSSGLILGGPNIVNPAFSDNSFPIFERVYAGLPEHDYVLITGKFWYFGDFLGEPSWNISIIPGSDPKLSLKTDRPTPLNPVYKKKNFRKKR